MPARAGELKSFTETIPNTLVKFDMVAIPEGDVTIAPADGKGESKKVHVKPFYIGKTEVPWELFDIYCFQLDLTEPEKAEEIARPVAARTRPSKPYGAPDRGYGHKGYPALSMHYMSAQVFCKWLSARTGKKYRVPTEAEWEYACRAGDMRVGPRGEKELDAVAWYYTNADDTTHPCATKKPNAWGLYDMLGNAGEWVTGLDNVGYQAGGTFDNKAPNVHPGRRAAWQPAWQDQDAQIPKSKWWLSNGNFVGMRVVCEE